MADCEKCGKTLEEGVESCPDCAQAENKEQAPASGDFNAKIEELKKIEDFTAEMDPKDIESNKVMAILAYFGLLFLVPLFAAKESKFARFHANQGLVLFLAGLIVSAVGGAVPFLGWFIILPVGSIITTVLMILGIINAATGKAKELPVIGRIKLLK